METPSQCKNGHPWPENLRQGKRQRYCIACAREASRRHRRKHGAKEYDPDKCSKGHPWTESNTYIRPDGYRECTICRLEKKQAWRDRQPKRVKLSLYEKLMAVSKWTDDGCLVATKYLNGHGYTYVRQGPRGSVTGGFGHRIVWETEIGPIPDGLVIDHLCRVRRCLNVDHMEPVTQQVNSRRGTRPDESKCRSGRHAWIPSNIYEWTRPDGRVMRTCRACRKKGS